MQDVARMDLTIALLMCGTLGAAQQPSAGPQPSVTFRAETNFVEVHAIVTDEGGRVRGPDAG